MTEISGEPTEPHPPLPAPSAALSDHETVVPSEPAALPGNAALPQSESVVPAPAPRSQKLAAALLAFCAVVLLAGAYLFWAARQAEGRVSAELQALEQRLAAIDPRLKSLEARPVPQPSSDLRPLEQRTTALEAAAAAADPARVALEKRVAALDERDAAFEQRPPAQATLDAASRTEIAALAGRVDQVVARQTQLGEAGQSDAAKVSERIATLDQRIAAATNNAAQLDQISSRAASLASIQAASGALAAGRPLGTVPGAPPALAQFVTRAPPTEASLRLSYPAAADAARDAGLSPKTDGSFLDRLWARAQSSVTVRQGDHVLVGDPIAGVLAHGEQQIGAGDLAGALETLDGLSGPAAAAMADWRKQAQSLLDAREALLTMARR